MEKSRILFFSYWYPNKFNKIFPVFTRKHAQAAAKFNDVKVLSLSITKGKGIFRYSEEVQRDEAHIETHQLYIASVFYKLIYLFIPLHYLVLKRYIRKKIGAGNFEIIHSNVLFPCGIVGQKLVSHFEKKHVLTEHWSRLDDFFSKNLYRKQGKKALAKTNAITAVSVVLKNIIGKYTANPALFVVPNVIDKEEFFYAPDKSPVFTFVAAANWTPPKNPFCFLDALKEIHGAGTIKNFGVCMIGNGAQLDEIKSRNYPFSIRYTGILGTEELRKELNKAHMFLHGSDFETFSTIIAEALMCGLPSVVNKVGIAAEVINEDNGYLAENTIASWVDKIVKCYNRKYEPEKIAAQLKDRYHSERVGRMFDEIYKKI